MLITCQNNSWSGRAFHPQVHTRLPLQPVTCLPRLTLPGETLTLFQSRILLICTFENAWFFPLLLTHLSWNYLCKTLDLRLYALFKEVTHLGLLTHLLPTEYHVHLIILIVEGNVQRLAVELYLAWVSIFLRLLVSFSKNTPAPGSQWTARPQLFLKY